MSEPDAPSSPAASSTDFRTAAPYRGIAAASVGLGFFGMLVFWWFPFGLMLGIVGFTLSTTSMLFGIRGGLRGENLALIGAIFSAIAIGGAVTAYRGASILLLNH